MLVVVVVGRYCGGLRGLRPWAAVAVCSGLGGGGGQSWGWLPTIDRLLLAACYLTAYFWPCMIGRLLLVDRLLRAVYGWPPAADRRPLTV